jgi:maltose alpha-D-glucosyltransferase/alpha-amylase
LEYLQSLGISTIWLSPFQPTPNRDNGYDISDFYGVDPRHGSSGDFVEFMQQARKRGIEVVMDMVVNHTSEQHPWFQQSRKDKFTISRLVCLVKKAAVDLENRHGLSGSAKSTWTYDKMPANIIFIAFTIFNRI